MGNSRARIFCSRNEAELISIDGYYRTAEEMHELARLSVIQPVSVQTRSEHSAGADLPAMLGSAEG